MVYIHHSEAQTMNKRAALCPFYLQQVKLTKSPGKPLKNFEKIFWKNSKSWTGSPSTTHKKIFEKILSSEKFCPPRTPPPPMLRGLPPLTSLPPTPHPAQIIFNQVSDLIRKNKTIEL